MKDVCHRLVTRYLTTSLTIIVVCDVSNMKESKVATNDWLLLIENQMRILIIWMRDVKEPGSYP